MNTTARTKIETGWLRPAMEICAAAVFLWCLTAPLASAQGSRKDDIIFGPTGHPVSGATIRVCQPTATGTPCSPLATVYTDATLTVTSANPFQTDGLGNYHFYAPAGRYQIQASSPQITGTVTQPDVILPADLSSSGSGNNISAFGLTLGGNLSVAGNTNVTGTLTATNFNPGALSPNSLNVAGNSTVAGPRPYIDVTSPQYGATGDGGAEQATGAITSGSATLTVSSVTGTFQVGMYIHVNGAGASGDVLLAKITNISGSAFTLSRNAGTTVSGAAVQEDDTLPIQAAMVAFCAQSGASGGGSIYFPPGNYKFSQYQTSNANAIPFQPGCQGMHFLGAEEKSESGTSFYQAPQSSLVANCGAAPNAKAAFELDYPNGNNTSFDNLVIAGCNKALYDAGANVVKLRNTWLSGGGTGTDASALHIADAFWFWMEGGGLQSSGTSVPSLLMTGDAGGGYTGVGNIYISNIISVGGPVQYIARTNINGAPSGHWVFRNWTWESGNGDLIQITNPSSYTMDSIGPITLDDVQIADNTATSPVLINFNPTTNVPLSGVTINNSFAGNKNWPAIRVVSGSINHYSIKGCSVGCTSLVVNSAGMPIGNGTMDSSAGFDSIADATDIARLINAPLGFANITGKGSGIRMTPSGSNFSTVGIDASNGLMFGISSQAGWNAQIFQGTAPNIDFAFAANYPPTAVSATMSNTGGSLGAGTVYGYVVSTTGADCSDSSKYSAPSAILGPYTLGTGVTTGSLTFAWTPAATGLIAINGYCVIGDSLGQYNSADPVSTMIAGASSTGATIGAFPGTPGPQPITRQMVAIDHLTPNSAIFNNVSLPVASAAPPYIPSCLASATCSAFAENSPFSADSFTRVNAASLGANWTQSFGSGGSLAIASNAATSTTSGGFATDYFSGQQFIPDQFSRATIHTFTNGGSDLAMVAVRMATNAETFYDLMCINGTKLLQKYVAGTATNLATSAATCAVNDVIELDAVGSSTVYLTALDNGVVVLTATDSSSPLTNGGVGIGVWANTDSLQNWLGGSVTPGNGGQSLFGQPNTWTQPQTFASPITSASLAAANKTKTCNIVRGDQSGSALTTGNIQPQGSLCYVDASASVTQVIVMADAGASTVQLGYRHNGSTTAITGTLTPATVSGVTDHVACANVGGTAVTVEGNSVTCAALSNSALTLGDFIETTGGAADGTTKRLSIAVTLSLN
jgi:hypothetical protein